MTSLTSEEVAGNEDPCAGAYAGGGTLGCGHGDRPEAGHSDGNQVILFFHTPDCILETEVKNILTSDKIVKPLPRREPDFLIQLKKKKNLFNNKQSDPFQSTYFF